MNFRHTAGIFSLQSIHREMNRQHSTHQKCKQYNCEADIKNGCVRQETVHGKMTLIFT